MTKTTKRGVWPDGTYYGIGDDLMLDVIVYPKWWQFWKKPAKKTLKRHIEDCRP